jgi:acetyl-CoA acetyltransferase
VSALRKAESDVLISGVGHSDVGRRLGRTGIDLTVQAALLAIEDAGLTVADIDGISTWPGQRFDLGPGFSPCGVTDLKEALRMELNWFSGARETPGQFGAIFNAVAAVSGGLARHVLCFRTLTESSSQSAGKRASVPDPSVRASGNKAWQAPFNAVSAANTAAMFAKRHMHLHGTTREHLGHLAITCREHAGLNPRAVYREPMTMDDYLGIRMISDPLCLYDCDVPCDGSTAIIISAADTAADIARPIRIEAMGAALHGRDSWDQRADLSTMAAADAAASMWARTDLRPADVDTAQLYDGFTFLALSWLEALGFCDEGDGGPFVAEGSIRLGGSLPMNTNGGQLSGGRLHAFGYVHEAVTQLRGEADGRQVAGAEVAVTAAGGGPLGGSMLLTAY